jgi:hypothetical protein
MHGMPADPTKVKMKQKLARYNLQFCAVSSQLGTHDEAIQAVTKAHLLMLECVTGCQEEFRRDWGKEGQSAEQVQLRLDLLLGLANYEKKIECSPDVGELSKNILKATHFALQIW